MHQADYVDIMKRMTTIITTLQEDHVWDASATDVFIENYLGLKVVFEKFGTIMTEYATIMDGVANRMEEADNNFATKFEGISLK